MLHVDSKLKQLHAAGNHQRWLGIRCVHMTQWCHASPPPICIWIKLLNQEWINRGWAQLQGLSYFSHRLALPCSVWAVSLECARAMCTRTKSAVHEEALPSHLLCRLERQLVQRLSHYFLYLVTFFFFLVVAKCLGVNSFYPLTGMSRYVRCLGLLKQ